ncbi:14037_t:CDS:2, partial [Racocetra fulgida]
DKLRKRKARENETSKQKEVPTEIAEKQKNKNCSELEENRNNCTIMQQSLEQIETEDVSPQSTSNMNNKILQLLLEDNYIDSQFPQIQSDYNLDNTNDDGIVSHTFVPFLPSADSEKVAIDSTLD